MELATPQRNAPTEEGLPLDHVLNPLVSAVHVSE